MGNALLNTDKGDAATNALKTSAIRRRYDKEREGTTWDEQR